MERTIVHRKLTAGDLDRMAGAGVFGLDERLELADGQLLEMTALSRAHIAVATRLAQVLQLRLGARAIVRSGMPLELGPFDVPLPDVVVLPHRDDYYRSAEVKPRAVHLVAEVADASLPYDRGAKSTRYGLAGVREYWIVDVPAETIERRCAPGANGRYAETQIAARGDTIALGDLPEEVFRVWELLAPGRL